MIFNVTSGGISNAFAVIAVTYPEGSTCTCSNGSKTLKAKDTSGSYLFMIQEAGTWTARVTDGENTSEKTVIIGTQYQFAQVKLTYRVPSGYQEVEFLRATGTQYIDSGLLVTAGMQLDGRWILDQLFNDNMLYGVSESSSNRFIGAYNTPEGGLWFRTGTSNNVYKRGIIVGTEYHVQIDANGLTVNGELLKTPFVPQAGGTTTLALLADAPSSHHRFFKGALVGETIIRDEGGNVLRDWFPCYRIADNVAGLWDRQNEVFYENAGSGTFIVGEDV